MNSHSQTVSAAINLLMLLEDCMAPAETLKAAEDRFASLAGLQGSSSFEILQAAERFGGSAFNA